MKRIRIIGLALVAVFALGAIASASASAALPELVNKEGKELVNKTVTTAGEAGTLEAANGNTVKCTKDSSTGTASGVKNIVKVVVTFVGCEANILGVKAKCNTAGQVAGTIVTRELEGVIGYINKAAVPPTVGQLLWPSSRTAAEREKGEYNALFVEFACVGFANSSVRGSIICQLTPVNTLTKTLTLTCAKGTGKGIQGITKLEGEANEKFLETSLNGTPFEKAAEETTNTVSFGEGEVQLKA